MRGSRRPSTEQPARPGVHRHHPAAAAGQFVRPRADQDRAELGIAVPLTAVLYGSAGTVVQVIRRGASRRGGSRPG